MLREAVARGVNHIDTSDYYGPHVTNQLIREALHPYPDDLVIVTKVGAARLVPFRRAGTRLEKSEQELLPDEVLPAETHHRFAPDGKPTFFGHYWFSNMPPAPTSPTTACVEYSIACGGKLVAYRWDGEQELNRDKYFFI